MESLLEGLDDFAGVEARAALADHAPPTVSRRLLAEAVAIQLRAGDADSLIALTRRAGLLTQREATSLALAHLGHDRLDRLLRPLGHLWHVAPLLRRASDDGGLVLIAQQISSRTRALE